MPKLVLCPVCKGKKTLELPDKRGLACPICEMEGLLPPETLKKRLEKKKFDELLHLIIRSARNASN